jgi:hypothetical protein
MLSLMPGVQVHRPSHALIGINWRVALVKMPSNGERSW